MSQVHKTPHFKRVDPNPLQVPYVVDAEILKKWNDNGCTVLINDGRELLTVFQYANF